MPVYIIRAGDTDKVKIGWAARDVAGRIRALQAGCWETLRLLRVVPGDLFTEGWLHRRFAEVRISREWFRFDPQMLVVNPPDHRKPPRVFKVSQERREQMSAAMRESWRIGRSRATFMQQHPELRPDICPPDDDKRVGTSAGAAA